MVRINARHALDAGSIPAPGASKEMRMRNAENAEAADRQGRYAADSSGQDEVHGDRERAPAYQSRQAAADHRRML